MLRGIITCVRTVKTRAVPFFMVRSARSGVHVLVILAAMRDMEELASKYFKRVDEVVYLRDGASIYNAFTWLNVNHKKVTFGKNMSGVTLLTLTI